MMTALKTPATDPKSSFASMKGNHVAFRVPDFAVSKAWFVEKLDFRVIHEWPFGDLQLAYLAPPNDNAFWIEILGGARPASRPRFSSVDESLHYAGYHHLCFDVASVDATLAELRRRNVTIMGDAFDMPEIGRRLGFFADPFGNLFELAETIA
jgi:catechol 2,3-dioxygenase-like lactoylglutathione lyase family enzyme